VSGSPRVLGRTVGAAVPELSRVLGRTVGAPVPGLPRMLRRAATAWSTRGPIVFRTCALALTALIRTLLGLGGALPAVDARPVPSSTFPRAVTGAPLSDPLPVQAIRAEHGMSRVRPRGWAGLLARRAWFSLEMAARLPRLVCAVTAERQSRGGRVALDAGAGNAMVRAGGASVVAIVGCRHIVARPVAVTDRRPVGAANARGVGHSPSRHRGAGIARVIAAPARAGGQGAAGHDQDDDGRQQVGTQALNNLPHHAPPVRAPPRLTHCNPLHAKG
jgi:hypothetical protein